MEYIIFLTYQCNLKCPYCFANNVVSAESSEKHCLSGDKILQIIDFIKHDINARNSEENSIVFFGGEPTLVPNIIDQIIKETCGLGLKYSIYTNGLLLDRIPDQIISKLNTILVAIDGDKTAHETYKPIGSFDKTIKNIEQIRKKYHGELIARITMEETTNIYKSVVNSLDKFDFVHWQIVNKPYFIDPKALLESYSININRLCDFWVDAMSRGIIYNIIPFNELMSYMLMGIEKNRSSFWCGCGKTVMAIDIEGNIYQCDEYISIPDSKIASIEDQFVNLNYVSHKDIFQGCKDCSVSSICLGRCRKFLETASADHLHIYCSLTHILIDKLEAKIDIIHKIIEQNHWELDCFPHSIYNTEVVP